MLIFAQNYLHFFPVVVEPRRSLGCFKRFLTGVLGTFGLDLQEFLSFGIGRIRTRARMPGLTSEALCKIFLARTDIACLVSPMR